MEVANKLIACVLCMLFSCVEAHAQYDFCQQAPSGQMLYYQIIQHEPTRMFIQFGDDVRVTHPEKDWPYYAGNKPVGDLVIPEEVTFNGTEYQVVEVGEYAFYGCDSLVGVVAPSVKVVGTQSFLGCTSLRNIMLGEFLLSPGEGAFLYGWFIGEGAFAYCRSLGRLTIAGSNFWIGISAFAMCEGLREVKMPPKVERLCDVLTFHGCAVMQDRKNRKFDPKDPSGYAVWSR